MFLFELKSYSGVISEQIYAPWNKQAKEIFSCRVSHTFVQCTFGFHLKRHFSQWRIWPLIFNFPNKVCNQAFDSTTFAEQNMSKIKNTELKWVLPNHQGLGNSIYNIWENSQNNLRTTGSYFWAVLPIKRHFRIRKKAKDSNRKKNKQKSLR